jgi:hypothetical protein
MSRPQGPPRFPEIVDCRQGLRLPRFREIPHGRLQMPLPDEASRMTLPSIV